MRIVITGVTGNLGRNILFEFIKKNILNLDKLYIFILGRSKEGLSLDLRIKKILINEGAYYINDKRFQDSLDRFILDQIKFINFNLDNEKLSLSKEDFDLLKTESIDFFIHVASLTDFRITPGVESAVNKSNAEGTKLILNLVEAIKVKEFIYIGTAYACGFAEGVIAPDHINLNAKFRNPYEFSKLKGEMLVRSFSKKTGIKCIYIRPSTICGRLIEEPLGGMSKFDVFYSWAAWFLRMKMKNLKNKDLYENNIKMSMRVCFNKEAGLNIVPVDYIAKVVYYVCLTDKKEESYYAVNTQETPHDLYITWMLNCVNVSGVTYVDRIPLDKNLLENFYYKTVGLIFTPYIDSKPMLFDISNLTRISQKNGLSCPSIDLGNFQKLLKYGKIYDFGLNIKK